MNYAIFYILDYVLYKANTYCKHAHGRKIRNNQPTVQACYEKCMDYKLFNYGSDGRCVCVVNPNEDGGCTPGRRVPTLSIYKVIE